MSHAAYRIRKRVAAQRDGFLRDIDAADPPDTAYMKSLSLMATNLAWVLDIIDEEIEREAERQFTRPIVPQGQYDSGGPS